MIIKNEEQRAGVIEAGKRLGAVLEALAQEVAPGVSTQHLENVARELIEAGGDIPSFLDYTPEGADRPYPAALCVSINDEVVHGIPNEEPKILEEGDIVSLDLGLTHKGFIMDSAITVPVGKVDTKAYELMNATQESLRQAIAVAKVGNRIGDISYATGHAFAGTGLSVVKALGGHGVGNHVHEEPFIANDGYPGTGPEIVEGMVLAIEPIAAEGKGKVEIISDGYTYKTRDGSRSAHFEHTILVTDSEPLILTKRPTEN